MEDGIDVWAISSLPFLPFYRYERVTPEHLIFTFDRCLFLLEYLENSTDDLLLALEAKDLVCDLAFSYLLDVTLNDIGSIFFESMPSLIPVLN